MCLNHPELVQKHPAHTVTSARDDVDATHAQCGILELTPPTSATRGVSGQRGNSLSTRLLSMGCR